MQVKNNPKLNQQPATLQVKPLRAFARPSRAVLATMPCSSLSVAQLLAALVIKPRICFYFFAAIAICFIFISITAALCNLCCCCCCSARIIPAAACCRLLHFSPSC